MPNNFSDRLRNARELRKLSQAELAEKSGLQPSAISHFESGRRSPSFQNLKAVADALQVTTDYLIGRSDEPNVSNSVSAKLFRQTEKMSGEDLDTLTSIAELLANKRIHKNKE